MKVESSLIDGPAGQELMVSMTFDRMQGEGGLSDVLPLMQAKRDVAGHIRHRDLPAVLGLQVKRMVMNEVARVLPEGKSGHRVKVSRFTLLRSRENTIIGLRTVVQLDG